MKKLFTFAAAVLASFGLFAADPTLETLNWGADDFSSVFADHDGIVLVTDASAWKGNFSGTQYVALGGGCDMSNPSNYFGITSTGIIDAIEVYWAPNGTSNSSIAWAGWTDAANFGKQEVDFMDKTETYKGEKKLESAIWQKIDLSGKNVQAIILTRQLKKAFMGGTKQDNLGDNQTINILGIRVWASGAAPKTDPVKKVTISGSATGSVGSSIELSATTDVKADTYYWTVDGAIQENSNSNIFSLALEAAKTYSVVCFARNQYNEADQFAASEAFEVVASEKSESKQVDVVGTTVWDWTKAGEGSIQFDGKDGRPAKDVDTVLLANVNGINNNAEFNAQALLFAGQYALRDGKYAQGPFFSFNTTVAGWVVVEFSNTGTKDDPRYVSINGVVNTEVGTLNTTKVESAAIEVPAGKIILQGAFADGTPQYLRVYKITFSTENPQGIEDLDASERAVKFIQDGQVLIRRGEKTFTLTGQEK